jgi:hypothetical protein
MQGQRKKIYTIKNNQSYIFFLWRSVPLQHCRPEQSEQRTNAALPVACAQQRKAVRWVFVWDGFI